MSTHHQASAGSREGEKVSAATREMRTRSVLDSELFPSAAVSAAGAPSDGRVLDGAGSMKRKRSASPPSDPERAVKHARGAVNHNSDSQAGLTVTSIMDAAWQAMERAVAPRDEQIRDNERRTHEILNRSADNTSSIVAFSKRQDILMTKCEENKRKLEHLQESKVSASQVDATIKDLKESFEMYKRQSQADNENQARRIQFLETELKKSEMPLNTDLKSLRATIKADVQIMLSDFTEEVQTLLSDFTKELKCLATNVDDRVASTARAPLSNQNAASMTLKMKKKVQDQSIKIAVETVRSIVSEDVPIAIERSLAPRFEAVRQAAGVAKKGRGSSQAPASLATPALGENPKAKRIMIPRSKPPVRGSSKKASASKVVVEKVRSGPVKRKETIEAEGRIEARAKGTGRTVAPSTGTKRVKRANSPP